MRILQGFIKEGCEWQLHFLFHSEFHEAMASQAERLT
jgi:hypothetical protein